MRKGGQNIKTVEEHKRAGTFVPSRHGNRLSDSDHLSPMQSIPDPPEHFDNKQVNLWTKVCEDIKKLGNLLEPDVFMIEMFVEHWFLWKGAIADVKNTGTTISVEGSTGIRTAINPSVQIMNESGKVCRDIADKFGFTARARMSIKVKEDPKAKTASILDLIKGGTVKAKTG
jgi:P27 family predicted phage terminase small subunit